MNYRVTWQYLYTTDARTGRPRVLAVYPRKTLVHSHTWREGAREWGDIALLATLTFMFVLAVLTSLQ
jgi:hypothetical protein